MIITNNGNKVQYTDSLIDYKELICKEKVINREKNIVYDKNKKCINNKDEKVNEEKVNEEKVNEEKVNNEKVNEEDIINNKVMEKNFNIKEVSKGGGMKKYRNYKNINCCPTNKKYFDKYKDEDTIIDKNLKL
jgi:hypothetical protein